MFNKVLCSFLCGCLVFMGLSASGGNIQIKTDHNANPYKALKKSDGKAEKTVNSDEDPYNYVVHNTGDPAPDELNYFIKGTDVDWMADFLQNHNDINYCLVLDKENNPVGVMSNNTELKNTTNTITGTQEIYQPCKAVPSDGLFKKQLNGFMPDWPIYIGFTISAVIVILGMMSYVGNTGLIGGSVLLNSFTPCWKAATIVAAIALVGFILLFIFNRISNSSEELKNFTYYSNLSNSLENWIELINNNVSKPSPDRTKVELNYNTIFLYPHSTFKVLCNSSTQKVDKTVMSHLFRQVFGRDGNLYFSPWSALDIKDIKSASRTAYVKTGEEGSVTFSSYTPAAEQKESVANSYGLIGSNANIQTKEFVDPDQGSILTKEYNINLGSMQARGLRGAPSDSYFMFWLNNQASSDLPYNVHFVSTTDDINGGYFILPQSSEMNWNTSDDHIPVPNANIFAPNDYTFENIADNENVTPYYEKDKNPGYDYMQITQSGKYCVFPIGFTGKDNSSSSTLEVWVSPNNGTAEDSYIHVGNIKAQYSSSDSQWHFTYTPVSTPSGWNVTAEKSDITGTSKEDMLSGTQLDNFGLSIVQEDSLKMAIQ